MLHRFTHDFHGHTVTFEPVHYPHLWRVYIGPVRFHLQRKDGWEITDPHRAGEWAGMAGELGAVVERQYPPSGE